MLWGHQERSLELLRHSYSQGSKWVLLVLPTGGGKTRTAGEIVRLLVAKGKRVLWCAHRDELVEQAASQLERLGLSVGVVQAGSARAANPYRPVQVASTQTLVARKYYPEVDYVILDECHHYVSKSWIALANKYRDDGVLGLGLTATPTRTDGKGLGDIFDDLVVGANPQELIDAGFLVPCEIIAPEQVLEPGTIAQSPLDAYLEHTPGRKAMVFASNVKAATEYMEDFERAGIKTAIVTAESEDRRKVLDAFHRGDIQVIQNVMVLTEGYDCPDADVCILARSCGSVSLYLQIVGRVLRAAPGKTYATLLDLYGASRIYGNPAEERAFALEGDGIRRKEDLSVKHRFCAVCGTLIDPQAFVCADCGVKRPELNVPYVVGVKLVKFAHIRKDAPGQRVARLAKWIKQAREAGHKPGKAYYRFKGTYGVAPSKQEWTCALEQCRD